jgi:uncharacterized protein
MASERRKSALYDVNVWIALLNRAHQHHLPAVASFSQLQDHQAAVFCRVTQLSLFRLLTQRSTMGSAVLTQREAWVAYESLVRNDRVSFLDESEGLDSAFRQVSNRDESTPNRWNDDYLVAFAIAARLSLITFDRALADRSPDIILLAS